MLKLQSKFKAWWSGRVMSFALLSVLLVLFIPDLALAQTGASTTQDSFQESLRSLAGFLAVIVRALTFICLFIMDKGMILMGTDIVIGDKAMSGILPIWVFVRNITNILFVGVILFIAVYNLLKNGQGDWSIKEKLPKVILALIAINFSLTAMKVMVEGVNVATVGVLSISDSVMEGKGINDLQDSLETKISLDNPGDSYKCADTYTGGDAPSDCKSFREAINDGSCKGSGTAVEAKDNKDCLFFIKGTLDANQKAQDFAKERSDFQHNIFLAFGIHFLQIENLPLLAADIPDFFSVVDNILFSAIMAIMYAVVFVALFIVLVVRVVVLWGLMMASPLIMAGLVLGIEGSDTMWKKFLTYLLIPLKIGAVFALTFVMSSVMIDYEITNQTSGFVEVGAALNQFYGTGGFGLIWKVMIVLIFWKAAFWALSDTDVEAVVQKVKTGAESVGKLGATWAASEIKVPTIEGKSDVSLLGLSKGITAIDGFKNNMNTEAITNIREAMGIQTASDTKRDESHKRIDRLNAMTFAQGTEELKRIGLEGLQGREGQRLFDKIVTKLEQSADGAAYAKVLRQHRQTLTSDSIEIQRGARDIPDLHLSDITDEGTNGGTTSNTNVDVDQKLTFNIEAETAGQPVKQVNYKSDPFAGFDANEFTEMQDYRRMLINAGIDKEEISSFTEVEIARLADKIISDNKELRAGSADQNLIKDALIEIRGTAPSDPT